MALYQYDDQLADISEPARNAVITKLSLNLRCFVFAMTDAVVARSIWKFLQNEIVHGAEDISFLKATLHFLPEAESKDAEKTYQWLLNDDLLTQIAHNLKADTFSLYKLCSEFTEATHVWSVLFREPSFFTCYLMLSPLSR